MKVAIATLGCKVNQYDSGTVESHLRSRGCEIVAFEPGADAYVINTCSVTDRADAESRRVARRARRFGPSSRVVMTGCFAQSNPGAAAIPEVDFVIGVNRLDDLLAAIHGALDGEDTIRIDDVRKATTITTMGADTFGGQTRAFLKIQEGCDLFCSFCIVPLARGRSRSIPPRSVLEEMHRLAGRGYREVVLTGVHLGGYGEDLTPRIGLADLVEMIAEVSPVPRVRLSSIDPPEITPRLLRLVSQSGVICPHFHVPIQSGHDRTLKRMRRRYSADLAREVIHGIREELPLAGIGTDVIAGFPGETEEEFAATEALLEGGPFTYLHVFPYSPRARTTAAKLSDPLPAQTIAARARRLREIDGAKRTRFASMMLGQQADVLLEEGPTAGAGGRSGYTRNYVRVEITGAPAAANVEVRARIISATEWRLRGEVTAVHA